MKKINPIIILWAWLIPGAGHWQLGLKAKGGLFFILIVATYFAGMSMANFQNVHFNQEPYALCSQLIGGGITFIALFATKSIPPSSQLRPEIYDLGTLYTCIAALLNLLIVLHICFIITKNLDTEK